MKTLISIWHRFAAWLTAWRFARVVAQGGYDSTPEDDCARKSHKVGRPLRVVYPGPYQVFLDLDSESAFYVFMARLAIVNRIEKLACDPLVTYSASGYGHRHVTLTLLRPIGSLERIALQSLLGSDPVREALSYVSWRSGKRVGKESCFFEPS